MVNVEFYDRDEIFCSFFKCDFCGFLAITNKHIFCAGCGERIEWYKGQREQTSYDLFPDKVFRAPNFEMIKSEVNDDNDEV